jgi:hypothetical protein
VSLIVQDQTHPGLPKVQSAILLTALLTAGWLAALFATLLSTLLTFATAGLLPTALITLTARSLLTTTRLTTLIFFSLVCHDFSLRVSSIERMRSSALKIASI